MFRFQRSGRLKTGSRPRFPFCGPGWLPLLLEPKLDLGQYLEEFGAKSMRCPVLQHGHRLELIEELIEIGCNLDILAFQHFSELGCAGTDGEFDQNDNSVHQANVDKRWSRADLLEAAKVSRSVCLRPKH